MSVQFGRWNFECKPVDRDYIERVKSVLTRYGPDDTGFYVRAGISILYQAFHTTKESRCERQPHVAGSGLVFSWDGRLDNRAELIRELQNGLDITSTDLVIVAAAYERWGVNSLAKLIGDWALSVWDPDTRSLSLAKDPIGTRHLYYSIDQNEVSWCTVLDPLVLLAGKTFSLDEEYIAGWLGSFPATHLSPYVGIRAVPPSSLVSIRPYEHVVREYWSFDSGKRIRYGTDVEYEEHFRTVFTESVRRRLRSDNPVLAELSGGVDSSSIVCMADRILGAGNAETPRLDTVSYYDDSEPNWNERPYFTKVEERRGRTGCHIEVDSSEYFASQLGSDTFAATPSSCRLSTRASRQLAEYMTSQRNRVILSGLGGDEVTGGVPTPIPELEDLIAALKIGTLAHQLKTWALEKRKPWFHLFLESLRGFLPSALVVVPRYMQPPSWVDSSFLVHNRAALTGYPSRVKLFGPLPSFQENMLALDGLRRVVSCSATVSEPCYEQRYPYLDRDLMEFLFSIPREQLTRPGRRRSLMRRALTGLVPYEVLNRRRKGFVVRSTLVASAANWHSVLPLTENMSTCSLGIIKHDLYVRAWQQTRQRCADLSLRLVRALFVEIWIRHLQQWNVLSPSIVSRLRRNCCGNSGAQRPSLPLTSRGANRRVHIVRALAVTPNDRKEVSPDAIREA